MVVWVGVWRGMRQYRESRTALGVAHWLAFASGYPELAAILPEGASDLAARLLRQSKLLRPWQYRLMGQRWFRAFAKAYGDFWLPGIYLHAALRKRFMDEEARAAITEGARQILLLGAGFDTLCLRLAAGYSDIQCLEVDRPATLELKEEAIASLGAMRPNLHLLPVDFTRTSLEKALLDSPLYRRDALTVFLAEGLLQYLPEEEVSRLFAYFRSLTAPGSRFVFSFIQSGPEGRIRLGRFPRLFNLLLRIFAEPMISSIPASGLAAYLEERGLKLAALPSHEKLLERFSDRSQHMPEDRPELLAVAVNP